MELSLICRVSRLAELPAVKLILASMPEPVNPEKSPVESATVEISSMVPSELIVSKKMDEFEGESILDFQTCGWNFESQSPTSISYINLQCTISKRNIDCQ